MNPQFYDYVMERLLGMEVQEVFLTPILMKKNRPATLVTIICPPEKMAFGLGISLPGNNDPGPEMARRREGLRRAGNGESSDQAWKDSFQTGAVGGKTRQPVPRI